MFFFLPVTSMLGGGGGGGRGGGRGGGSGGERSYKVASTSDIPPIKKPPKRKTRKTQAHLVISAIKVTPVLQKAFQHYPLGISLKNIGQGPSDEYNLCIFIKDLSNGFKEEVENFQRKGLQPGEEITVYSSISAPLNDPSRYQVQAEIQPFAFEDRTAGNPHVWNSMVK